MFRVVVIADRCKGCGICVDVCPRKVLIMGNKVNNRGYRYVVVKAQDKCIGCRMCEIMCPDFAIYVEKPLESN